MLRRIGIACCVLAAFLATVAGAEEGPVAITTGDQKDRDPMISPDGDSIAFSSNRLGQFDIFVYNYKTRAIRQLTESPKDDRYPNWSADTKRIIFTSDRTGKGDVYEMALDGSEGFLQLTALDVLQEHPSYMHADSILFARSAKRTIIRHLMEVVVMDRRAGPGNLSVLADGTEPRLSPDGKKIVFVSRRTKNNDIWLMNLDGSLQTQLTTDEKDDENPCFSPDGKQIAFASDRTGNFDIWVMDADGGNIRQLTSAPTDETQPCWSVGRYLYYTYKTGQRTSNIYRVAAPR